jgi:hypothetical protein
MEQPMEGPMPGMATPGEIERLGQLPPDRADGLFLRLMITHHQAAIPMAEAISKRTEQPEVRQLGRAIEQSQRAEIESMKALLKEKVGDSAQVDLQPQNESRTRGSVTLSKIDGGVKVALKVFGLPNPETTMYLAHIHPGTCGEEGEAANTGITTTSKELTRRSSTPSHRWTRTRRATGRARRWCETTRSKACSQGSLSTSTYTPPVPENRRR